MITNNFRSSFKFILILFFMLGAYLTSFSQPGRKLFNDSFVHKIEFEFNTNTWHDTLYGNRQKSISLEDNIYTNANVIIDGNRIDSVGIRYKGEVTFNAYSYGKAPFKIDFNEFVKGKKYDGIKKVNLHNFYRDPSRLREKLCYDLFRDLGLNTVRVAFTELWINGELRGLYSLVEQIDKTYLENNHGTKKGNLYKAFHSAQFIPNRDTSSRQPDSIRLPDTWYYNDYPFEKDFAWEKKTNKEDNDWSDLYDFERRLSKDPLSPAYQNSIEDVFDLTRAWKIIAFNRISQTTDAAFGTAGNFYVYNNPNSDKIEWIPWDYNWTFDRGINEHIDSLDSYDIFSESPPGAPNTGWNYSRLQPTLNSNPSIKQKFLEASCQVIQLFDTTRLFAKIDYFKNQIRSYVQNDPFDIWSINDFEGNSEFERYVTWINPRDGVIFYYPGVKQFIQDQNSRIREQLSNHGLSCGSYIPPTDLLVSPSILHLEIDDEASILTQLTPLNSSLEGLVWYSEDWDIVEIEQTGDLEAKSEGVTRIVVSTTEGKLIRYIDVIVGNPLSTQEESILKIELYPIPSTNDLYFSFSTLQNEADFKIIDATGKQLFQQTFSSIQSDKIDISSLSIGIYWLSIQTNDQIELRKFIKE